MLHADFLKIYNQFLKHISNQEEAKQRYHQWVLDMNLDETRSYANSMREQFQWVRRHVNFELWKEDGRAKYWMVEAAYPLESMNENLYTLDELRESTRTVKGKSANLNHKFPLPTIDIEAAKYEGGVAECVIRVPKSLMCPICDTSKTINDLIEEKGIVNVSLEAVCTLKSDDPRKCEGMEFTGLALLTNATLPGIPLTRLMPLEHIMVEALQTSTKRRNTKMKRRKVKPRIIEQVEEPCPEGEKRNPITGKCEPSTAEQANEHPCGEDEVWDPRAGKCVKVTPDTVTVEQEIEPNLAKDDRCPDGKMWDAQSQTCVDVPPATKEDVETPPDLTNPLGVGQRNIRPRAVEPDESGQCPEGYILHGTTGKCVLDEECPENQHFDQQQQQCVDDTTPVPVNPETAVGIAAAPAEQHGILKDPQGDALPQDHPMPKPETPLTGPTKDVSVPQIPEPIPEKDLVTEPTPPFKATNEPGHELGKPKPPHTCPDGHHYDPAVNQCVPNEPITEIVKRLKAEAKLVKLEQGAKQFENYYLNKHKAILHHNGKLLEAYNTQRNMAHKMTELYDKAVRDLRNEEVKSTQWKRLRDEATGLRDDYKHGLEKLKLDHERLQTKYHSALTTNLTLSQKNTTANEEYLEVHRKLEHTEEQLKKARNLAKKVVKIRA